MPECPADIKMVKHSNDSSVLLPYLNDRWIVLMQRGDNKLKFSRKWADYKKGFYEIGDSNFWIGLETMHDITMEQGVSYELLVQVQSIHGTWYTARYKKFSVDDEQNKYKIHISGYSGNAGDSLTYKMDPNRTIDGMGFSTIDSQNDPEQRCAKNYSGGMWFNKCTRACLTCGYYNNFGWDHLKRLGLENTTRIRAARIMIKRNNPCHPNPCRNGGKCSEDPTDYRAFQCNCASGWIGKRCKTNITSQCPAKIKMQLHSKDAPFSLPYLDNKWIVLMQRCDDTMKFDKDWSDFKNGFHDIGEFNFWIGLETMHNITMREGFHYELLVQVQSKNGKWYTARYKNFSVDEEQNNYKILISGYSGNAGDSMTNETDPKWMINGMNFSTIDSQNDPEQRCAKYHRAGMWFNNCTGTCLTCSYYDHFGWDHLEILKLEDTNLLKSARMLMRRVSDPCKSNPCKNGAPCNLNPKNIFDFQCACRPGWVGKACELSDSCKNNPCKNGAQCSMHPKDFRAFQCACANGFIGKTCELFPRCPTDVKFLKNNADLPYYLPYTPDDWILIMQRCDNKLSFNQNWNAYKHGFGFSGGYDFWIGLEVMHRVTGRAGLPYKLRIEMQAFHSGKWYVAEYATFSVDTEENKYKLRISGYSGDAGNALDMRPYFNQNGMYFSTPDWIYGPREDCIKKYNTGWWFNSCFGACLTCSYGEYFGWDKLEQQSYIILRSVRMMVKKRG